MRTNKVFFVKNWSDNEKLRVLKYYLVGWIKWIKVSVGGSWIQGEYLRADEKDLYVRILVNEEFIETVLLEEIERIVVRRHPFLHIFLNIPPLLAELVMKQRQECATDENEKWFREHLAEILDELELEENERRWVLIRDKGVVYESENKKELIVRAKINRWASATYFIGEVIGSYSESNQIKGGAGNEN